MSIGCTSDTETTIVQCHESFEMTCNLLHFETTVYIIILLMLFLLFTPFAPFLL